MAKRRQVYFWQQMPFVRLILPLLIGIVVQFYLQFSLSTIVLSLVAATVLLLYLFFLPLTTFYKFRAWQGAIIHTFITVIGALLVYLQDVRHHPAYMGSQPHNILLATVNEPPVEKAKTYKAEIVVQATWQQDHWSSVTGKALAYFSKDQPPLSYGSTLLIGKPLEPIKNAGNPGSFNYQQYNAYQNIYHQVFLKATDYVVVPAAGGHLFQSWLFQIREKVIATLKRYISGHKQAGVAEALLIGYRNDLDKDLVQAYSNTGVVHIIAISGLHLGLIYASLLLLLRPFKKLYLFKWLKPIMLLTVLWVFTLLAGAAPSILRSAVMFSFIVVGETLSKKSSIYNTLAASAFVMLCINPFYLWDVGFLLSYSAVISIVMFSKHVYNWFYLTNKFLDFIWKLVSVTLSAQVLTAPIIFYFFHQFANLFLLSNCLVVPLSSVILFAELTLIVVSFAPIIATPIGIITNWLLGLMNNFIELVNQLPFAVYNGIQNSLTETVLLYLIIVSICYWLLYKHKVAFLFAATCSFAFVVVNAISTFKNYRQTKVVVYNIPQFTGIDFISGTDYAFAGDLALLQNPFLTNFHLKPARILYQVKAANNLNDFYITYPFMQFRNRRILLYNKPFRFTVEKPISVDLIILSHNPTVQIAQLLQSFKCNQFVFDGSNSAWRIEKWKTECDSMHVRYHNTSNGAFVLNL